MYLAVRAEKPDLVIHLGDGEGDLYRLEQSFPGLGIENVAGNCDWRSTALRTLRLDIQRKYMSQSQAVRIQYSSKNSSVS